jgi:hypothetical protein
MNHDCMLTSGRRGLDHPSSIFGDPIAPLGFVGVHLFIVVEVVHKLRVILATWLIFSVIALHEVRKFWRNL